LHNKSDDNKLKIFISAVTKIPPLAEKFINVEITMTIFSQKKVRVIESFN
jgi:hypothetical protein